MALNKVLMSAQIPARRYEQYPVVPPQHSLLSPTVGVTVEEGMFNMSIEYVQEQMTWWGPTIQGATGQNYLWVSGVPIIETGSLKKFIFPPWVPQKFFITFCRATHQGGAIGGQFAIIKDTNRIFTNSSRPPVYQDGDHSRIHTLSSIWLGGSGGERERNMNWDPPVFFDQAVDCLRVQLGIFGSDMANFQLGILRAAPVIEVA
jgi:hypothetical protein